jgi:hypothetical protein
MGQIVIPGNTSEVSDGYHTFEELYDHRTALFISFLKSRPTVSWMSKRHCDNSQWEGWFVAGTTLPTGDITYHLRVKYWDAMVRSNIIVLDVAPKWDRHTSKDVLDRLLEYVEKY